MLELRYLTAFEDTPEEQRDAYVAAELRRIVADGEPLLTSILRVPDDEAKSRALELLREGATETGEKVFETSPGPYRLRLADGVTPPDRDPQARKLGEPKRGKTLIVKLGNKGGRLPEKASGKLVAAFSGKRRQILVSGGADLYEQAEITREWKSLQQRDATLVLMTWGIGVQTQKCLTHMGKDGEIVEGQSFYLVEEEPQAREIGAEPEGKPAKGRPMKGGARAGAGA